MRTLSGRLKKARTAAKISARRLDKLAGLTPGHTTLIESGRRPNPTATTAAALARALDVSLEWLVSGRGAAPTSGHANA
jgi:transcriptional regulator with XRE-family HTH domain